jgi:hypothetical protein
MVRAELVPAFRRYRKLHSTEDGEDCGTETCNSCFFETAVLVWGFHGALSAVPLCKLLTMPRTAAELKERELSPLRTHLSPIKGCPDLNACWHRA